MMKKMTKVMAAVGVTALATLVLAGCGGDKKDSAKGKKADLPESRFEIDSSKPGWENDKDNGGKLTWYVNFDWYAQPGWGVDTVTRKIKEDTNIDVEFISGGDEKLNTMMASGELPDIMTFDRNLKVAKDAPKFALPLNQLAEKYDPYFTETAAKPETLKWYTKEDGNVYGYPSFSVTQTDYDNGNVVGDQVFVVRKDIYEKIGKPDMTTQEGFLNALKKAKEVQPQTDDGSELIPFASTAIDIANGGDGALGGTLQDFLGLEPSKEGKFNDRDAEEEYISWLETFRQAYQDGLISKEQFSDNDNTMKEKLSQGKYFAYLHNNTKGLNEFMSTNNKRNPEQEYIAVDGPANSNGDKAQFTGGSIAGWTNTFITTSTKDPQTAINLLTYLTSQYGNMVTTFGVEGETYNLVDGQAVYSEETEALRNSDIARFDKEVGLGSYWFAIDSAYTLSMGEKPATSIRDMVRWSDDKIASRFEIEDMDEAATSAQQRNITKINTERVQALVAVMQAGSEKEGQKVWEDFLASRKNNNWETIVDIRNDKIQDNIEKLK